MLTLILQGILLYGLSVACWHVFRQYVVKTALDNIPGPPSPSFFKGLTSPLVKWTMSEYIYRRKLSAVVRRSRVGVPYGYRGEV